MHLGRAARAARQAALGTCRRAAPLRLQQHGDPAYDPGCTGDGKRARARPRSGWERPPDPRPPSVASLKISMLGRIILCPQSLFKHKPQQCPFGHSLTPGRPQTIGWKPCVCTPAREAARDGRGMGHLLISCGSCHDELRSTTFYEPPHDIRHRQAGPWLVS